MQGIKSGSLATKLVKANMATSPPGQGSGTFSFDGSNHNNNKNADETNKNNNDGKKKSKSKSPGPRNRNRNRSKSPVPQNNNNQADRSKSPRRRNQKGKSKSPVRKTTTEEPKKALPSLADLAKKSGAAKKESTPAASVEDPKQTTAKDTLSKLEKEKQAQERFMQKQKEMKEQKVKEEEKAKKKTVLFEADELKKAEEAAHKKAVCNVDGHVFLMSLGFLSCNRSGSMDVLLAADAVNQELSSTSASLVESESAISGLKSQLTRAFFCDPALTCIVSKAKSTEFVVVVPPARGRQPTVALENTNGKPQGQPKKSPKPKGRGKSPKKNGGRSKSPRRNKGGKSKSPARPKMAAAAPTNGQKNVNGAAVSATKKLPLHVQFDPFLSGLAGATQKMSTNAEHAMKVLSLPQTSTKATPPHKGLTTDSLVLPPSYLEVEPLMSLMVPEEIAEAINLELSKKWDEEEMLEEKEEEEDNVQEEEAAAAAVEEPTFATPTKPTKENNTVATPMSKELYMTPPKDFKGKVTFFEKLTKQKLERPRPTPMVKAKRPEVSEKVHQARTSLSAPPGSPVRKVVKTVAEELPKDMTPIAQKRERVDKFFDKGAEAPKLPPPKPKARDKAAPSTTTTTTTLDSAVVEEEPLPAVDDVVSAMEKDTSKETANGKGRGKSPKRNNKGRSKSPRRNKGKSKSPARPKKTANAEETAPAPAAEDKTAVEKKAPEPVVEEKAASPAVEEKEPAPAPAEEKAPAPAPAPPAEEKAPTPAPAPFEEKAAVEEKKAAESQPRKGRSKSPRPKKGKSKSPVRQKKQEPKPPAAEETKPEPVKPEEAKSSTAGETKPQPTSKPTEKDATNKSEPGEKVTATEKSSTGDDKPKDVLQDKTNKKVAGASAESVSKPAQSAVSSEEEVHGELLSRDVATEVLEDATEEFPSLADARGPKPSAPAGKSYAQALSQGKKKKEAETAGYPEYLDFIPQLTYDEKVSFAGTLPTTVAATKETAPPEADAKNDFEGVKMEEMAQRLAEGTPQKKLEPKPDEAGPVEESKQQDVSADPGFTPINKGKKKKKSTAAGVAGAAAAAADDGQEASQPSDHGSQSNSAAIEIVEPTKAAFKKDNFNQYSALEDLGDIPTEIATPQGSKKEKTRPLKTGTQQSKKKSVRFGGANPKEGKGAKNKSKEITIEELDELAQSPPAIAMPLHALNTIAHTKPICYILDALVWVVVLLLGAPIGAVGIVLLTAYKLLVFFPRLLGMGVIKPKKTPQQQLAVVITGCDSGFGKDLAFTLLNEGFVVFCGCLRKESMKAFAKEELAIPMVMDVTKDSDVSKASKQVKDWLAKEDGRYMHALVNNAGIGTPGLVDWVTVAEMQKMVDVNFLGMVRTTKAFLPHFKSQASEGDYSSARIVNMVSAAGLVSGGLFSVGYEASKHAAEVFSTNLRLEMKGFGLKVTVINPSFHQTTMTKELTADLKKKWKSLSPEKRREYGGEEYINLACNAAKVASQVVNWDSQNVIDAMQKSVAWKNPPAKLLVGGDMKYIFIVVRMLPTWVSSRLLSIKSMRLTRVIKKTKQD